jgi:Uma2 family endonuclease
MGKPKRRLLTYADLLAADDPFHPVPELVDGEIVYKASPGGAHAYSQGEVHQALAPARRRGGEGSGWWILVEPDVLFSVHRALRPDLGGWRKRRLPRLPVGAIRIRPDWVCEVLSRSNALYDRTRKLEMYREECVPHLWLLHPVERTLEAFARRRARWTLLGAWTEGDRVSIEPFDAIKINVGRLFVPREAGPDLAGEEEEAYGSR